MWAVRLHAALAVAVAGLLSWGIAATTCLEGGQGGDHERCTIAGPSLLQAGQRRDHLGGLLKEETGSAPARQWEQQQQQQQQQLGVGEDPDPQCTKAADAAFQIRSLQADYSRVMSMPCALRQQEYEHILTEAGEDPRCTSSADAAFQIRGLQADYHRVMAVDCDKRESEFNAIKAEFENSRTTPPPEPACSLTWTKTEGQEYQGHKYFLAKATHNCDAACAEKGVECDEAGLDLIEQAEGCRAVMGVLGLGGKPSFGRGSCFWGNWGPGNVWAMNYLRYLGLPGQTYAEANCSSSHPDPKVHAVCTCFPAVPDPIPAGGAVMALADDGLYHAATVVSTTSSSNGSYAVAFEDGGSATATKLQEELVALSTLLQPLQRLTSMVRNATEPSEAEWEAEMVRFTSHMDLLDAHQTIVEAALQLVTAYEAQHGPLFINAETRGSFPREKTAGEGLAMARGMLVVQQAILDKIYHNPALLGNCSSSIRGRWKTSSYMPGPLAVPSTPFSQVITINARNGAFWGRKVAFCEEALVRPTGLYLAPGGTAQVRVPAELVGKGYAVQVGALTSDHIAQGTHRRMDRITTSAPVTGPVSTVANPLGGGIYIVVPYLADDGVVTVEITGDIVEAPAFFNTSLRQTSAAEWERRLAGSSAPWADFESDKFMMQVPRAWIFGYNFSHISDVMASFELAMQGFEEMHGYYGPGYHRDKTLHYEQVDIWIKHGVYGVGYPQVNNLMQAEANPELTLGPYTSKGDGRSTHWMATAPLDLHDHGVIICWHELGHAMLPTMYRGESEAINHMGLFYVRNVKQNLDLDTSFAKSLWTHHTPDQAAVAWMIRENFRNGLEMDYSGAETNEFRYQHKGYAKYADIVRLFGWDAIKSFNHQHNLDFMSGAVRPGSGLRDEDARTLGLSIAARADLTALIHFWGIHPVDGPGLSAAMQQHNLTASPKVRQLLERYTTLVPRNASGFLAHYREIYGDSPQSCSSPLWGCGWYDVHKDLWDEITAAATVARIHSIIATYFGDVTTE